MSKQTVITATVVTILGAALMALTAPYRNGGQVEAGANYKPRVAAAFEDWRTGTGSPFDLLSPEATWTITGNSPMSRNYVSKQEFLDEVIKPFNGRMSKRLVPLVRGIFQDGDMLIVLFDAEGTARDGKPYRNTYTWYMRFEEGSVIDVVAFFDTIEFTDLWNRVKPAVE